MLQLRLKQAREQAGLSQAALAKKIGVGQSTVGMWENGKNKPEYANLERLAQILDCSTDYLLGRDDAEYDLNFPPAPTAPGSKWVPILGRVAAGVPIQAVQEIEDWEEVDAATARRGELFGLRVRGDSMTPLISDGDVVICHQQDDCESGEIAVVVVNGDEATVKRIKKRPDGLVLIPSNPAYEPLYFTNEDVASIPVTILGKVIEQRRKY